MSRILKFTSVEGIPVLVETPPLPVAPLTVSPGPRSEAEDLTQELLQSARREAQQLVDSAKAEAANILQEAHIQAETIRTEAHEQGLAAGMEDGREKGLEEGHASAQAENQKILEALREQASAIVEEARVSAQLTMQNAERDIVEIAMTAARKILSREIEENPLVLLPVIREALDKVRDQEQITVRVNPDDFDMIIAAERDLQKLVGREYGLTFRADHAVQVGGCLLETENGVLDAGIDTQYETLLQAIQEILP